MELPKPARDRAIASIQRYFRENMEEPYDDLGNIAAGGLLNYFLEEIAPSVYNQGVLDAQERIAQQAAELDIEIHETEFAYWRKFDKARKK